ncbi:hypothetical protein niasHT_024492 [Heterodera trifolii]|uniref:Uncharacterized protein n=1 Tax=Heterodera trifolii TaxID=157864 RepID=A0ABD2K7P6_9BILA
MKKPAVVEVNSLRVFDGRGVLLISLPFNFVNGIPMTHWHAFSEQRVANPFPYGKAVIHFHSKHSKMGKNLRKIPVELLFETTKSLRFDIRWATVRVSASFDHYVLKCQSDWLLKEIERLVILHRKVLTLNIESVADEKERLFQVVSQLNSERRSIIHRAIASHFGVDEKFGADLVNDGATDHEQFCGKLNAMVDHLIDYTDAAKVAVTGEFFHHQVRCAHGFLADMNQISNLKLHISWISAQSLAQHTQLGAQQNQITAQQNQITAQFTAHQNQITAQFTAHQNQITAQQNQITSQQNQIGVLHDQVGALHNELVVQHNRIGDLQARNTALLAQNSPQKKRKRIEKSSSPSKLTSEASKSIVGVSETTVGPPKSIVGPSESIVGALEATVGPSESAGDLSQTGGELPKDSVSTNAARRDEK